MFTAQNDAIEFTEDDDRRFQAENVLLHRHFQENLEDAKYARVARRRSERGCWECGAEKALVWVSLLCSLLAGEWSPRWLRSRPS